MAARPAERLPGRGPTHLLEDGLRLRLVPSHTLNQAHVLGAQQPSPLVALSHMESWGQLSVIERTALAQLGVMDQWLLTSHGIAFDLILRSRSRSQVLATGLNDIAEVSWAGCRSEVRSGEHRLGGAE